MLDILIIVSVAAVFDFGWYLMRKLDAVLESKREDSLEKDRDKR